MKKFLKFLRFVIDLILFAIVLFILIIQIGKWQKMLFIQAYRETLNNKYLTEKIIQGKQTIREI
jgi:hypothetical protein